MTSELLQQSRTKVLPSLVIAMALAAAARAQYVFEPTGSNWSAVNRWRINGILTGADYPNAIDASATFNLPLDPSATFIVGFNGAPDPVTVGHLLINSSAGHAFDTQFGTSAIPGTLAFQVSSGSATYTETAGASNGSPQINSSFTLLSNLIFTQDHVDSNNPNNGTVFNGMLNGASGITFTKEGNANVVMTNATVPSGGNGFFGSYIINQGAMRFVSNSLLMNAEGFAVNPGGQLQIGGSVATVNLADGASLTLGGTGVSGGPANNDGALRFQLNADVTTDFNSPIILASAANISVQNGSAAIVARLNRWISGPGGLTKTGGDDLYLSGSESNSHEGGTAAADGRLFLNKSGGAVAVPGNLNIGGDATVVLQQDHQIADDALLRFTSTTQQGILRLGGTNRQETVGGLLTTNPGAGIIETNSNDASSLATLTIAAVHASRFEGVIRDAANTINQPGKLAIVKSGAETLELTNANTYSGGTTLSEGALLVNNTADSGLGTGAVSVAGGTLGGRGFIGTSTAPVDVGMTGGTLNPGDASPGALNVFGGITLGSGATMHFDLGGATAGTEYDQLVTFGSIDLGGATLELSLGEFVPNGADSFTLINNTDANPIVGSFNNYAEGDLISLNGAAYAITYTGGDGGNDVVLNPSSVVLDADFNGDSIVDGTDFLVWQRGVGTNAGASHGQGDANGDQAINGSDLNVWKDQYGTNPAGVAAAAAPEPTSIALIAASACSLAIFTRRRSGRREG
jgi:fibronectin-binding autotransporter adhesin